MPKTPIFGPYSVALSKNLADAQCINLLPLVEDTRQGKAIGALFQSPGLNFFSAAGSGPIWNSHVFANLLFVISNNEVYSVDTNGTATLVGSISGVAGPISMIDNGTQLGIFTSTGAWLIGLHGAGVPLTGGTISAPGTQYNVGDEIFLEQSGGVQQATAAIVVTSVSGSGGVTGFSILVINGLPLSGSFSTPPTNFSQKSTSGSGSGLVLSSPTFGPSTSLYPIPLPFALDGTHGPIAATQLDGFVLISQPGTYILWQSDLLDMSVWDPLAFAEASANPDIIRSLQQIHQQVYVIENFGTEIWVDAGAQPFAFQRLSGVYIEKGTSAPASVVQIGEDLMWLAKERDGANVVIRVRGYAPEIVSDFAVSTVWNTYSTTDDAIAYSFEQNGKWYYVISFPSGNSTWIFNATDSEILRTPMWSQLAAFGNGAFSRHWAQSGSSNGTQGGLFNNNTILGDYRNGNLYVFSPAALTDNGTVRKWLRSWRAQASGQSSLDPIRFNSLQIDMQTGINVPIGTTPQVVLRWSDDGGHNWSSERFISVGPLGATAQRVKTNRLGSTRRNSGLDRIFELSSTDVFPVAIINAEVN